MKIALIADVHGNLPALKKVLKHARALGAREIWNAGDSVGFGPYPDEVLRLLKKSGALSILGNADSKILRVKSFPPEKKANLDAAKWQTACWSYEQLSPASRKYLRALPHERRFVSKGWKVLITHGSPVSQKEYIGPDTPEERLRELAAVNPAQIIVFGHSHRPFARLVDETWFINPGSIGRPEAGDTRASYALLKIKKASRTSLFSPGIQ